MGLNNFYLNILLYLFFFTGGFIVAKIVFEFVFTKRKKELECRVSDAQNQYKFLLEKAEKDSKDLITRSQSEAENRLKTADVEVDRRMKNIERLEEKVTQKEEKLESKMEQLEKEKEKIYVKEEELWSLINEQKTILSKISKLSPEEAKDMLFEAIENENKQEIVDFVNKFKTIKQEESMKEAWAILAKVLPRVWMNEVSEFTLATVEIPSEDIKWKIIWREWRNISYFERITWVELLIDDTPLVVKLSSFDPEKRFIASETLKKLIKDWRINPIYIEKYHKEISLWLSDILLDKWKEALSILNLGMMKPEIVKMIGQYHLRYSYWQNLWIHSIEVARLAEALANEIGLDWQMAKKAWLLHDIWKITTAWNGEAHAKIWADILRQHWFDEIVINAAESHHYDVPLTHPISRVVAAADAISASRPWARFNTKDFFTERMANLEKLILSLNWVDRVYIMQAWREIMTFVNPGIVDEISVEKLVKEIAAKIESQLDYPWVIRVVAIRETKVVDYLR